MKADDLKAVVEPTTPKFQLLVSLGTIEVPADYDHAKQLGLFLKRNHRYLYTWHDGITDANFSNPSRILSPGDRILVKAWRQIVPSTTSEECLAFLRGENSMFLGAQGASLVFTQKREQLPRCSWCASFDEKDRLWRDATGEYGVPSIIVGPHRRGFRGFLRRRLFSSYFFSDFVWMAKAFREHWSTSTVLLSYHNVH